MIIRVGAAILLLVSSLLVFITPIKPEPIQKTLQVVIEGEDPVMVELFGIEIQRMASQIRTTISLIDKEARPYDLRIILTSGVGSKTDTCDCSSYSRRRHSSTSSCSITHTFYFTSAVVLRPQGTLQSGDTGVGITRVESRRELARRLISRL